MSQIHISVIIPAYNEEKYISKSIESIKDQKTSLNYEIIVVNNNSKDKTEEVTKKHNVKVINEQRQGVGQARKTGTDNAKGKIVVHIDADSILYPDYLEKVWKHFKKEKDLVCLGGQFLFYDAPLWKNILRKIFYRPILFFAQKFSKGILGPSGNNMAFRINAYKKTKGFNACLRFGEDIEICRELRAFGKIKVDMNLKVQISARRYKVDKNFFLYIANFLSMCFLGKPYKNHLPECN